MRIDQSWPDLATIDVDTLKFAACRRERCNAAIRYLEIDGDIALTIGWGCDAREHGARHACATQPILASRHIR